MSYNKKELIFLKKNEKLCKITIISSSGILNRSFILFSNFARIILLNLRICQLLLLIALSLISICIYRSISLKKFIYNIVIIVICNIILNHNIVIILRKLRIISATYYIIVIIFEGRLFSLFLFILKSWHIFFILFFFKKVISLSQNKWTLASRLLHNLFN